jgi:uroporphyrinogen-III synthase
MPQLLITRPVDDAQALIDRLGDLGVDSIVAPVMDIHYIGGPALDLTGVQGFLLTSANGVRALAVRTERRDIPCFAVGDATAREAERLGFAAVASAGGDVDGLAALVFEVCKPAAGTLLHAAGTVSAGDLAGALAASGFKVRRERLYDAKAVAVLPSDARAALSSGTLDGVAIYSPRTARLFGTLVADAGLSAALERLTLFALSDNVSIATEANWKARIIAARPDQESLLDAVRTCYY